MIATIVSVIFAEYTPALQQAYDAEVATTLIATTVTHNAWILLGLVALALIPWIIGLAGLYFFKWWARPLSLCSAIFNLSLSLFMGATVQSPLETTFIELSSMLYGAILGLSYFSAIGPRYERRSEAANS